MTPKLPPPLPEDEKWRLCGVLYRHLVAAHARFREEVDVIPRSEMDNVSIWPVGRDGALMFYRGYVLTGWPDDDMKAASLDAYRILEAWLREVGPTEHMVYPLNLRSVRLTRKLGAVPHGVDPDGYVHYTLTLERFLNRGKK